MNEIQKKEQIKKMNQIETSVLNKVTNLITEQNIKMPEGYDPNKAIINACLVIKQDEKLSSCTQISLQQSLLNMATLGLDIASKQVYLIPYGNTAKISISYFGQQTLLRRIKGVKDIVAQCIYEGDSFDYSVVNGNICNVEHKASFGNRDKKVIGAYATITLDPLVHGRKEHIEVMTIEEIKAAWGMGATKGKSKAHENFPQEMSKKSVINRAVKNFVNTLTDNDSLINAYNKVTADEYSAVKYGANNEKINQDLTEEIIQADYEEVEKERDLLEDFDFKIEEIGDDDNE